MLFGKMVGNPKVDVARMRTHLAHRRVRDWLRVAVADMVQDQSRRQSFICDMREHVARLESNLTDPLAFVVDPSHLEKCSLVMYGVLRLMPTGRWRQLEKLIDRLEAVALKTRALRTSISLLPAEIDLKEDRYPPAWQELA